MAIDHAQHNGGMHFHGAYLYSNNNNSNKYNTSR